MTLKNCLLALLFVALPIDRLPAQQPPLQALVPYRINPGDEIEVHVWGEERLQRTIRVLPDGTFSFPLVGQIVAANRLPSDVEKAVSAKLTEQYRNSVPFVTVSVISPSGLQFSVVGKVRSPGAFTPGRYVNVLEALSLAGGPSEFANLDDVTIIRKTGNGLVWQRVRLGDAMRGNTRSAPADGIPQMQAGDTVVVR